MKTYTLKEAITSKKSEIINAIKNNKIIVYPTDTVYGIGCNALNEECTKKVYEIKQRPKNKPVSVIAPSFDWIIEHFDIDRFVLKLYFPGPYTLILKKKNKDFLKHISDSEYIGVRIPDHEISMLVAEAELPLITTSANISGEPSPTSYEEINQHILEKADLVIIGECHIKKPSTIINPYTNEAKDREK